MRGGAHINELHEVVSQKSPGRDKSTNLLVTEIQELIKLNTTVREGTEDPFFLKLGSELGIGSVSHGRYVERELEVRMMWL